MIYNGLRSPQWVQLATKTKQVKSLWHGTLIPGEVLGDKSKTWIHGLPLLCYKLAIHFSLVFFPKKNYVG